MFSSYDYGKQKAQHNIVDLGMAHGITSILQLCTQCICKDICVDYSLLLGNKIVDYLLKNTCELDSTSYFPNVVNRGELDNVTSRLAWCYGDLNISYSLFRFGLAIKNKKISNFSRQVLLNCVNRRTVLDTRVYDACICHGSSGVAHIYSKVWKMSTEKVFAEAYRFWINKTIDFKNNKDLEGQYKKFNPITNTHAFDESLLEGTTGIGLVLLSRFSNDFEWDYCLMLNS